MTLPEFVQQLSGYIQQFFTLDPNDPFKTGGKVVAIIGTVATIVTTLATKTYPWLRSKLDSRSVSKRIGAELYTKANLERAVRYYVSPYCQALDPAGAEEPRLVSNPKQRLFEYLDEALVHPTEYKYIFLLADSGMGKTSALLNYYVRHIHLFRKPYDLVLIPLGIPDADERIAAVQNKHETVLFLDALDEDTLAIIDHKERLRLLLKACQDFQRVLISCRTQFFSRDEEIPRETGKIKIGIRAAGEPAEHYFHKIYLSPFTDEQVKSYLRRRYPIWRLKSRRRAKAMVEKIPHLTARPMLLAHVDDLVNAKRQANYSYELYEEMVEAWLRREQGFISNKDDLRQFSERLAVDLFIHRAERGAERIMKEELTRLAVEWNIPLDDWKLSGRSLLNRDVEGNFKFAHRSIMEYLFVVRFIQGDRRCLDVEWTDQMYVFLWEKLIDTGDGKSALQLLGSNLSHVERSEAVTKSFLKILLSQTAAKLYNPAPFRQSDIMKCLILLLEMLCRMYNIEPATMYTFDVAQNEQRSSPTIPQNMEVMYGRVAEFALNAKLHKELVKLFLTPEWISPRVNADEGLISLPIRYSGGIKVVIIEVDGKGSLQSLNTAQNELLKMFPYKVIQNV